MTLPLFVFALHVQFVFCAPALTGHLDDGSVFLQTISHVRSEGKSWNGFVQLGEFGLTERTTKTLVKWERKPSSFHVSTGGNDERMTEKGELLPVKMFFDKVDVHEYHFKDMFQELFRKLPKDGGSMTSAQLAAPTRDLKEVENVTLVSEGKLWPDHIKMRVGFDSLTDLIKFTHKVAHEINPIQDLKETHKEYTKITTLFDNVKTELGNKISKPESAEFKYLAEVAFLASLHKQLRKQQGLFRLSRTHEIPTDQVWTAPVHVYSQRNKNHEEEQGEEEQGEDDRVYQGSKETQIGTVDDFLKNPNYVMANFESVADMKGISDCMRKLKKEDCPFEQSDDKFSFLFDLSSDKMSPALRAKLMQTLLLPVPDKKEDPNNE